MATVGASYTIQADVRLFANSSGGGTGRSLGVFLDNEPGNPLLLTEFLDGNRHAVWASFTATSTSATVIFAGELDARTPGGAGITDVAYFIDDISVTPSVAAGAIPALSEQALLALGIMLAACAGLALRQRRAQRERRR